MKNMKSKFLQCLSHQIVDHSPTYGKFLVDTGAKFSLHNRAPLCLQHPPGAERTPAAQKIMVEKPHCPKKWPSGENPPFLDNDRNLSSIFAPHLCHLHLPRADGEENDV